MNFHVFILWFFIVGGLFGYMVVGELFSIHDVQVCPYKFTKFDSVADCESFIYGKCGLNVTKTLCVTENIKVILK